MATKPEWQKEVLHKTYMTTFHEENAKLYWDMEELNRRVYHIQG